jgi:hypothetical protein
MEAEVPGTPGQTVHAPSGITRELAQHARKALAKIGPVAGKIATDVATKAATTEATSFLDKHHL